MFAESDRAVVIEGNHYFPPAEVKRRYLEPSGRHSPASRAIKDHVACWHGVKVGPAPRAAA